MKSKFYAEIMTAGNQVEASAWGCEVGQSVGRIYPRKAESGERQELKGTVKDVSAWIAKELKKLEK